jgi:hypothetical protein
MALGRSAGYGRLINGAKCGNMVIWNIFREITAASLVFSFSFFFSRFLLVVSLGQTQSFTASPSSVTLALCAPCQPLLKSIKLAVHLEELHRRRVRENVCVWSCLLLPRETREWLDELAGSGAGQPWVGVASLHVVHCLHLFVEQKRGWAISIVSIDWPCKDKRQRVYVY